MHVPLVITVFCCKDLFDLISYTLPSNSGNTPFLFLTPQIPKESQMLHGYTCSSLLPYLLIQVVPQNHVSVFLCLINHLSPW